LIAHARSVPVDVAIHLQTRPDQQAALVLCPGDPDRSRLVAGELFEAASLVTETRGLLGFTGRYRGVPVTVQTTGMGGGSTGIVVHELIELGARLLVRAGTTGALQEHLEPGSLVVADAAVAADGAGLAMTGGVAPPPDPELTEALMTAAEAGGRPVARGTIVSTDLFYDLAPGRNEAWQARGILAVEMEAAVLFALAERHGARAGCVLTVSNRLVGADPGWLGANQRRQAGLDACRVALEALVAVGDECSVSKVA
jgi:DeoD family purine-nucleoside phosphorylase